MLVPDEPTLGVFGVYQATPDEFGMGAHFRKRVLSGTVPSGTGGTPEIDHDGACRLYHYDPPPTSSAPHVPQAAVDAGELRVTGGLTDLTMTFEDGYASLLQKGVLFETGDALTLHIEGSDVVSPMSVTFPAPPPPVIALPPATIDIGEDLTLTWTSAPGTGSLNIDITTWWDAVKTDSGTSWSSRDVVGCTVDVSQGTVTMPASLLSQISPTSSLPPQISASVANDDTRQVGDDLVGFRVETYAATPSGGLYLLDVDLK